MSLSETIVEGTLNPDGTLELDQKPTLSPGRVTVVLRQLSVTQLPPRENWWQVMQDSRNKMVEAGCHFMDDKEIQDHIEWLREGDRIDDLLRESRLTMPAIGAPVMVMYCDSVILMYFFDHTGQFNVRAGRRLAALAAAGDRIAISELVRLEYRVKPLKNKDTAKLAFFDHFCAQPGVQLVPINKAVFDRATVVRASHNFKLGDSLHLAAAAEAGCDCFLTNDSRLASFADIRVEVLP